MKKEFSFKMWLTVFFKGIWQFVRNLFSWTYSVLKPRKKAKDLNP